jgi:hypothetical protein
METGIYIDGSHMSNIEFSIAVIRFAFANGFEMDYFQFNEDVEWLNGDETIDLDDERLNEILDFIEWTYMDAVDYLNDTGPYWSLYLTSGEEQLKLW